MQRLFTIHGHEAKVSIGSLRELLFQPTPFAIAAAQLKKTEFGRILKAASKENSPDVFRDMIKLLLQYLDAPPPEGVIVPRANLRGRPPADQSLKIQQEWERRGRPVPEKEVLSNFAAQFYPEEWSRATRKPTRQKKLRDRVRGAIYRQMFTLRN